MNGNEWAKIGKARKFLKFLHSSPFHLYLHYHIAYFVPLSLNFVVGLLCLCYVYAISNIDVGIVPLRILFSLQISSFPNSKICILQPVVCRIGEYCLLMQDSDEMKLSRVEVPAKSFVLVSLASLCSSLSHFFAICFLKTLTRSLFFYWRADWNISAILADSKYNLSSKWRQKCARWNGIGFLPLVNSPINGCKSLLVFSVICNGFEQAAKQTWVIGFVVFLDRLERSDNLLFSLGGLIKLH